MEAQFVMAPIETENRSVVKRQSVPLVGSNVNMETIGDRVRALREAHTGKGGRPLSRQELADAVGMSKTTLQTLEDKPQTTSRYLPAIAAYFGVNVLWLQTGKGARSLNDSEGTTENKSPPESESPSHLLRVDRVRMRDAIELLGYLAELQAVHAGSLTSDPEAIAIAYDYLTEMGGSVNDGNILDMTKRLAAKIRGDGDADNERGKAS